MSLLSKLKALVTDPPPEYAFEVSEAGIAYARPGDGGPQWAPLAAGTLSVSPLGDNVKEPRQYEAAVRALAPAGVGGKRRPAALILPDYAARVAVLDFDTFPSDHDEQQQLARFRVKRAVPFDIESALVSVHPQQRGDGSKKIDVVVAVINMEVASHLEAPFRAAGFQCGFVTLSALAALGLQPSEEPRQAAVSIVAKLSGNVLALSLLQGSNLRMFRCVELQDDSEGEATNVLATTFAYAEDELGQKPQALRLCGVPRESEELKRRWSAELEIPVTGVTSKYGTPGAFNAGLAGYLETLEAS
jgi:type IV pilus assembly protein PilM